MIVFVLIGFSRAASKSWHVLVVSAVVGIVGTGLLKKFCIILADLLKAGKLALHMIKSKLTTVATLCSSHQLPSLLGDAVSVSSRKAHCIQGLGLIQPFAIQPWRCHT